MTDLVVLTTSIAHPAIEGVKKNFTSRSAKSFQESELIQARGVKPIREGCFVFLKSSQKVLISWWLSYY
jgi:hypothetical protein